MQKIIFLALFALLFSPVVVGAQGQQTTVQEAGVEEGSEGGVVKTKKMGPGDVVIEEGVEIDEDEVIILDQEQERERERERVNEEENEDALRAREEKREGVDVEEEGSEDLGATVGLKARKSTAEERRSRVSNAVQEMLSVAERNQGVGEQIRVVAQEQNRIQEEAEGALKTANNRGRFMKFIIGPDFRHLKTVEERLENHTQNLNELQELREQVQNEEDKVLLNAQIEVMENVKQELEEQVAENKKGFSLFGWLFKIFSR